VTDTLTHFHPGNFHQRKCHPSTSDKIKTFHPKRFHPRNAIPESDKYQDISSKIFSSQTQMPSQKVTDTLTIFHPRSFNPRKCHLGRSDIWWHVIHEILSLKPATACMKNFSSKKLDYYLLVKRFGMERVISFILTTVYSPNETVFIHPFFFSSRSICYSLDYKSIGLCTWMNSWKILVWSTCPWMGLLHKGSLLQTQTDPTGYQGGS
jgi:hypothetical protein